MVVYAANSFSVQFSVHRWLVQPGEACSIVAVHVIPGEVKLPYALRPALPGALRPAPARLPGR